MRVNFELFLVKVGFSIEERFHIVISATLKKGISGKIVFFTSGEKLFLEKLSYSRNTSLSKSYFLLLTKNILVSAKMTIPSGFRFYSNCLSGKFRYYTWRADGTEFLNEMPLNELDIPALRVESNVSSLSLSSNVSAISETGTQTDLSPERELLDSSTISPKQLIFAARNGTHVVKKPSISVS